MTPAATPRDCADRQWQKIETAPDEGEFLVFSPSDKPQQNVCRRRKDAGGKRLDIIGGLFGFDRPKATHWMPLPEPPHQD